MVVRRVEALGHFLETDDGRNLLAGYKRAANILRIEEKKDGRAYDAAPDAALIAHAASRRSGALPRPWRPRARPRRRRWRRRISPAPCGRSRRCARRSTRSSSRSR